MTTYEKVISDINGSLDEESKKQSIAQALLCPDTTEEDITDLIRSGLSGKLSACERLSQ